MKRDSRDASMTRCDVPAEAETRTNALSLSTLKQAISFSKDVKEVRQSASVDCAEMNSANLSIFAFHCLS